MSRKFYEYSKNRCHENFMSIVKTDVRRFCEKRMSSDFVRSACQAILWEAHVKRNVSKQTKIVDRKSRRQGLTKKALRGRNQHCVGESRKQRNMKTEHEKSRRQTKRVKRRSKRNIKKWATENFTENFWLFIYGTICWDVFVCESKWKHLNI